MPNNALIVGVSHPQKPLPGAANDVAEWKTLVETHFAFKVDTLEGPKAIKSEIQSRLIALLSSARSRDKLLFFISCHGTIMSYNGQDFPALIAYSSGTPTPATVILDTELNQWITHNLPPGVQLTVIVDACHASGPAGVKFLAVPPPDPDELEATLRSVTAKGLFGLSEADIGEPVVLLATDKKNRAYEVSVGNQFYGLFCHILADIVRTNVAIHHDDAMTLADRAVRKIRPDQFPWENGLRLPNPFFT